MDDRQRWWDSNFIAFITERVVPNGEGNVRKSDELKRIYQWFQCWCGNVGKYIYHWNAYQWTTPALHIRVKLSISVSACHLFFICICVVANPTVGQEKCLLLEHSLRYTIGKAIFLHWKRTKCWFPRSHCTWWWHRMPRMVANIFAYARHQCCIFKY